MLKAFQKTALVIVSAIACLSLPVSANTVISLNLGSATGGTWGDAASVWSGSFKISQVQIIDPGDPNNGGVTYSDTINLSPSADDFSITFSTGSSPTLTMTTGSAQSPFSNIADTALFTGTTGLTETCTGCTATALSLAVTAGTTTGVNALFLSDIGLAPGTVFTLGGTVTGNGGSISSDTLTLTTTASVTPTPEPSSMFLLAAGLAIAAALARKRNSGAAKSASASV